MSSAVSLAPSPNADASASRMASARPTSSPKVSATSRFAPASSWTAAVAIRSSRSPLRPRPDGAASICSTPAAVSASFSFFGIAASRLEVLARSHTSTRSVVGSGSANRSTSGPIWSALENRPKFRPMTTRRSVRNGGVWAALMSGVISTSPSSSTNRFSVTSSTMSDPVPVTDELVDELADRLGPRASRRRL